MPALFRRGFYPATAPSLSNRHIFPNSFECQNGEREVSAAIFSNLRLATNDTRMKWPILVERIKYVEEEEFSIFKM